MSDEYDCPCRFEEIDENEKRIIGWYGSDLIKLPPTRSYSTSLMKKYAREIYNFKPKPDDIWLVGSGRSGTWLKDVLTSAYSGDSSHYVRDNFSLTKNKMNLRLNDEVLCSLDVVSLSSNSSQLLIMESIRRRWQIVSTLCTTLLQEILFLLGTDFDYEKASTEIMDYRFPILYSAIYNVSEEGNCFDKFPELKMMLDPTHKRLENVEGRRFIKSHYGFEFIHPMILEIGCKVVFIARNPKDVIVSCYFYPTSSLNPNHCFEKFWPMFKMGLYPTSEYFEMLKGGWERRHSDNMLLLFYEEVIANKRAAVLKIADFLGKTLTEEQLQTFLEHIDIKKFKENKSLNNDHFVKAGMYDKSQKFSFIRQGRNGGWEELFPQNLRSDIDEWIQSELAKIPEFEVPDLWRKIMKLS